MIITVDSSVWIDFFRGRANPQTKRLERLLDDCAHELVILDVVLLEVLRGIQDEQSYRQVYDALLSFAVQTAGGKDHAMASAQIYPHLRKNVLTVRSTIDLLVAAWCLSNDCELLHNDRDFDAIASFYPLRVCEGGR
jgi:predicted nucleic acid-binding protein